MKQKKNPKQTKKHNESPVEVARFLLVSAKDERIVDENSRRINFRWFPFWMDEDAGCLQKIQRQNQSEHYISLSLASADVILEFMVVVVVFCIVCRFLKPQPKGLRLRAIWMKTVATIENNKLSAV